MSARSHHESLRLQNFTAFADASFEFLPGINVFTGENGTGKTHAMKAMYAWQLIQQRGDPRLSILGQVFQLEDPVGFMRDHGPKAQGTLVSGLYDGHRWQMMPPMPGAHVIDDFLANPLEAAPFAVPRPVFIAALDMMGHTKGFVSTYDEFKIDFDLTQRDIVSLFLAPERRELDPISDRLAALLGEVLAGDLELEGERFFLRTSRGKFPMPSVAEGLRKVATLLRLVQCGWLRPGATLFWDEPEVNLNPKLMDEVVGALLTLSRSGVQIFLATHSYVILKELDLQSEEDEVRYFAFAPTEKGTSVTYADHFAELDPNPILDQYDKMLMEDMQRADRQAESGVGR